MLRIHNCRTADEAWVKLALGFSRGKVAKTHIGRGGETQEILHAGFSISDPRQRWIISRNPAINPAFALAEVIWILSGRDDSRYLTYWNSRITEYSGNAAHFHGAYGFRLRKHFKLDQLDRLYHVLKNKPETRQAVLQIWDCESDLPRSDGKPVNADIPCNVFSLLKVRDGKLEWTQVLRSNDLLIGVPHNIVQFTYLQEIIAGWLGLELGSYNHISDSLHVYTRDLKHFSSVKRTNTHPNRDSVSVSKQEWEKQVGELLGRSLIMINPRVSEAKVREISVLRHSKPAFQNILLILAAEAARRHRWSDTAWTLAGRCTNPAFLQLWARWCSRVGDIRDTK